MIENPVFMKASIADAARLYTSSPTYNNGLRKHPRLDHLNTQAIGPIEIHHPNFELILAELKVAADNPNVTAGIVVRCAAERSVAASSLNANPDSVDAHKEATRIRVVCASEIEARRCFVDHPIIVSGVELELGTRRIHAGRQHNPRAIESVGIRRGTGRMANAVGDLRRSL